jgi:two-component sensor histidine kinase/CheY-like chemotaxis protein
MTLAAVVDISGRKRAEAQRELLLAELNHRVKNTLAVVQGIAHQSFKETDPEARKAFEGRLVALAVAHNLLTRANWESASLEQLAADTLHTSGPNGERVSLSGPQVLLPPREALALAMALHELCTNAVKYGALSNDAGRITLEWRRTADPQGRLKLVWREAGGPPVSPPKRRGFGSLLLDRTLAHDLDGTVTMEFKPQGSCAQSMRRCRRRRRISEAAGRQEDPLVEDEVLIAEMVVDMLTGLGATVIGPATSLEAGLSLAGSESIDAAVLDINLRGERIDPIADLLDARGIPVLFATGYGMAAGRPARNAPVIDKPYTQERLATP